MTVNEEIIKQGEELVARLTQVKEAYLKNEKELTFSIRRDVVAVQLKDILLNNPDYFLLKAALETYIEELIDTDKAQK